MENKHTKTEWILCNYSDGSKAIRAGKQGFVIAEVTASRQITELSAEDAEANANLITAAPELYNALYDLLQSYYSNVKGKPYMHESVINASNALNRATGIIKQTA